MTKILEMIKLIGASIGALIVISGAWIAIGGWTPASSAELEKLNKKQVEYSIRTVRNERRDLKAEQRALKKDLIQAESPEQKLELEAEIEDYSEKLKELEEEIKLLKNKAINLR